MSTSSSLGQVSAVMGAQWGDEGKGKLIDILTQEFDVLARACGGANAGHTIVVGNTKHVFRLLPSGCLHAGKPVILGGGMVIHLPTLLEEIGLLEAAGIEIVSRLKIYSNAHIVFDFHKEIDGALEAERAAQKGTVIGTTKRGIGPAYMDKAARRGLRLEALHYADEEVRQYLKGRAEEVQKRFGVTVNIEQEFTQFKAAQTKVQSCVIHNGAEVLHNYVLDKKRILIEGAQATLLDIDHGTYPYVTSSQTTLAGALQGLGLAPKHVTSCIGVAKAYCTRVGSGPFLTEADEAAATRLRERGGEYGSVTGRPRRCGWISIPDLQHSAMLNGFDCWNLTKLDVLDAETEIPVAVSQNADGEVTYEKLPGWNCETTDITDFAKLPKAAQDLVLFIEKKTGLPVRYIGTGRSREAMIVR